MTARVTPFEMRRASGFPITMHVIALPKGEVFVHSPTVIDEDVFARVEALGVPRILFAPNHFHHLGLAGFRARFPGAAAVAAAPAIPRLRRRGHDGLVTTEATALPPGFRWLVPDGTRSGEAWLSVDDDGDGGPTWIVCDAFFHESGPVRGLEGAFLRAAKVVPGLCIGATFTTLCIADRARYRAWVADALAREKPLKILFSHGAPIEEDAAERLTAVLRARLG
jgi:hypothetical protein